MAQTIITKTAKETFEVGERFASAKARIICLYGNLGSGKTTFVQGFAKRLGLKTRLLSPTFIIVRRYNLPKNFFLYHIDLYRLKREADLDSLGISEIFTDPRGIVIVEWADKLGGLLPKDRTDIHFSVLDDGKHSITITRGN